MSVRARTQPDRNQLRFAATDHGQGMNGDLGRFFGDFGHGQGLDELNSRANQSMVFRQHRAVLRPENFKQTRRPSESPVSPRRITLIEGSATRQISAGTPGNPGRMQLTTVETCERM